MISRIVAMFALVAGVFITSNVVAVSDAAAERVYDYTQMRWVEVDPNRRKYTKRAAPRKFNRRNVTLRTKEKPGTIIIHTDEKFLYYITGKNRAIRYGVGVGREGFGWNGRVKVKRKVEWPTWTPPREMIVREAKKGHHLPASMKGGIENPLGARALYLFKGNRDTLYRIHGTNQPWSIGLNLTSGCIRMVNKDVEHLYKQAKIGTNVVVIGPGQDASKYFTASVNPLAALFGG
ncbi:MAG: L,D-transpeptidase [Rhizobiaceae bacterium]|nr:L,D-transpeptidase [Rhizobiaceae bacterium]